MPANPNLLLTQDRREKVEAKIREVFDIAEKRYEQKFEMPEIRYDIKNTDGGTATFQQWLVRLNLILMVENEEKFLNTTVPHEAAHLIARRVYHNKLAAEGKKMRPHGIEWKEVMKLFDIPAKVNHSYDCTSIQRPHRRKRGSKLRGAEADVLLHRLMIAAKRFPKRHLAIFINNLVAYQKDIQ